MTVSAAYLNSCTSKQSQTRIEFELKRLAKLMHLTSVDDIDWHRFDRAAVVSLLSRPELKTGFLPLTQDNNYDVIYKQTANYRQTEPAG